MLSQVYFTHQQEQRGEHTYRALNCPSKELIRYVNIYVRRTLFLIILYLVVCRILCQSHIIHCIWMLALRLEI